ncbi:MAG: cytochrome c biogenesis protein CcdA [Flavobacteriales bacterium]|nr:cytochrome c biogenesis protein CcdA [Flavobacteriales bacterium]
MKKFILSALLAITVWAVPSGSADAQIYDPIQWDRALFDNGDGTFDLVHHAALEEHWHIYSQLVDPMYGPIPTSFYFETEGVETDTIAAECTPLEAYDPNFMLDLKFFAGDVRWVQTVRFEGTAPDSIKGSAYFMVCDDSKCLPPDDAFYAVALSDALPASEKPEYCPETTGGHGSSDKDSGILMLFFLGMGLGFAALLTPCVFPLIPMTVSFFTKQSKTKAEGIRNATIYGLSIIVIYTGLGLLITALFGVDVMNAISTDPFFNIFLFLLLVIFGASFLGAFEIQLPQSWAGKMDAKADKGGLIGIFFMAATLAIVSFSCTGPLIGSALAGAATGDYGGPIAVMFGFSLALAIPFSFFAAFPGLLNSLPQSGGWLNTVKVFLGLLEIGFAFKFLSNADLVLQLGLLKRELFIAIWVMISLTIALYMFGALRFPHDSKLEKMSVPRWATGAVFMTLAIYMLPGTWGAPVKLIAGFPPPMFYSELSSGHGSSGASSSMGHGVVEAQFHDYEEGLAAAREQNKPMLLDFTGWACVNCRKMEEQVWTDPRVANMLNNDVILVSLYVDERTKLDEADYRDETYGGKSFKIRTIGKKWSYMQADRFGTNAQPFYALIDLNGEHIGGTAGYDPDPDPFVKFLKKELATFTNNNHTPTQRNNKPSLKTLD